MIKYRTQEWYKARIGKFTASNFGGLMSKPADKTASISKTALNCIEKAAAQLFYNTTYERPDNDATRWGVNHEEEAIKEFVKCTNLKVLESGFTLHPKYPDVGATPDAIFYSPEFPLKTIITQIKCPYNADNHTSYRTNILDGLMLKSLQTKYFWQVQGEIWVTNSLHGYFVSYNPRENEDNRLHIVKVDRDETALTLLESKIVEAIEMRNNILEDFLSGRKRPKSLDSYW